MSGPVTTFTCYVNKTTEAVNLPPAIGVVLNTGPIQDQSLSVSAPLYDANGNGVGNLFIQKNTNLDQEGNTYATWKYTFNFNEHGPDGAGLVVSEITLLNNTSWPDKFNPSSNPSELILPSGSSSQTYNGIITGGTNEYYGATGVVEKTKDASNIRKYVLKYLD
jgi:hypothetical protein